MKNLTCLRAAGRRSKFRNIKKSLFLHHKFFVFRVKKVHLIHCADKNIIIIDLKLKKNFLCSVVKNYRAHAAHPAHMHYTSLSRIEKIYVSIT